MNIRIFAGESLFLAANVGYIAGETGNNPVVDRGRTRTAERLDAAAPVFKHQMLAEMRSMLRAFLPFSAAFAARISLAPRRV